MLSLAAGSGGPFARPNRTGSPDRTRTGSGSAGGGTHFERKEGHSYGDLSAGRSRIYWLPHGI